MKKITISIPGKLMIMGEHAVVYGKPCIVTAVDPRMRVTVEILAESVFRLDAPDVKVISYQKGTAQIGKGEIPKEARFVEVALLNFINKYKINSGLSITTKSEFSTKSGLGSSAAVTVGVLKGLAELFKVALSEKALFDLSYKTVLDVQSKGSGFDVAAAIYGGTLYFQKAGSTIESLPADSMNLVVGYTGVRADTVSMVNLVSEKMKIYENGIEKIFENIGNLVNEGRQTILTKDWQRLGTLMDYNQNYLEDLGVSTDKLNLLIDAAKKAGALGAKLSGAGRGDCMIALVTSDSKEKVSRAIENAGGQIMHVNINAAGATLEDL